MANKKKRKAVRTFDDDTENEAALPVMKTADLVEKHRDANKKANVAPHKDER
jgi:hypothetical protein